MSHVLIVYASSYGQTKKIANAIADQVRTQGHSVHLVNAERLTNEVEPGNYDAVVVGASVHLGNFSKKLRHWVAAHSALLTQMPSAFFSVCLGILQKDEKAQSEEKKIVADFLSSTDWQPGQYMIFAGALEYSKYNWFVKWMMKKIAKKAGGATDVTKDYEYTDWAQVQKFTQGFCHSVVSNQ